MTTICQAEVRAIFVAKTVRTFCYGFLGIALPVYLSELGLTAAGLGVAVTLTLAGSALLTWLVRRPAERYGGRPALIALGALSALAAVILLSSRDPRLVVLAAMLGNVAVGTGETGPFLALEQVRIARAVAAGQRTAAGRTRRVPTAVRRVPRRRRGPVHGVRAPSPRGAGGAPAARRSAPAVGVPHPPPRRARGARRVRRRLRAPVAGRLLPPRTLRPRSRGPRRGLLRHASPHGRLAAARRPRGRALRAPRDDGGLAPGVQRGADPHRVGAHGRGRDRAPVPASPALADGRADPAGVRDGPRRGPRARGGGDHHQHRADRRPGGHARADGVGDAGRGARGAVRGGRRSEDRLRPAALLDLQRRQAEARRVRGSRGSSSGGDGTTQRVKASVVEEGIAHPALAPAT